MVTAWLLPIPILTVPLLLPVQLELDELPKATAVVVPQCARVP